MSDPKAFTGNMAAVNDLVQRALKSSEGVEARLLVSRFGSMDACKKRARSLQQSFSSLRNRVRRLEGADRVMRDTFKQGPLDHMGCITEPLPNEEGWRVWLGPAQNLFDDFDVIDCATGKPLEDFGSNKSERSTLIDKAFAGTLTASEWDRGVEIDPTIWHHEGELIFPRPNRGGDEGA